MDECSVGFRAFNFLFGYHGLRGFANRDPCHRDWNDVTLAVKRAGLWGASWTLEFLSLGGLCRGGSGVLDPVTPSRLPGVVAKLSLVFNLSRGPWNQGDFGKQLREGAAAFHQLMNADSDLVRELVPLIAFDRGLTDNPAGLADDVLKEMTTLASFNSNGTHVTLRRWFSWTFASEAFDPQYSIVAMVLQFIASQSPGWDRLRP